MTMFKIISKIIILLLSLHYSNSAKIFGFFPTPSISHQVVYQPIWRELALRGHQVTVVTPNPLKENITNLKEIDVGHGAYEIFQREDITKMFGDFNVLKMLDAWQAVIQDVVEFELEHPDVMEILNGTDDQFDVILVENLAPLVFGFQAKFKVPVIGIISLDGSPNIYASVGNPAHPIMMAEMIMNRPGEATFFERVTSFVFFFFYNHIYETRYLPLYEKSSKKYFGEDMPPLGVLERNMSLLILNTNPVIHTVRPTVPAMIEINQMHIKPKKPLPNDLQTFLDDSSEGVVYFSLGSNVKSSQLEPHVFKAILEALGELPYKVLWKWETDTLPNQPRNVKISKWLPQQDILGHPNIKVFVTQGGIQSVEESLSNGVPMVGIPFIADQSYNVRNIVKKGVGVYVPISTMTKDILKDAILEVAQNDKYREKALEMKWLLQDQPMTGLEKAVWWIEYVIRHKGAAHMVCPIRDMPLWKYYCLDCVAFLVIVPLAFVYVSFKVIVKVLFRKTNEKLKTS